MGASKKILVVDDERGIRYLLLDVLSSCGFDVVMAKDGNESLEQMKDEDFGLIITDINMPGLDGLGVLKWMKKTGRKEKVIVMSGDSGDGAFISDDFPPVLKRFSKPFKIGHFIDVVTAAMANGDTPESGRGRHVS